MSNTSHIIIVGAGPVGCLSAYILASEGFEVTIVEALDQPAQDLRASTFHPPTLDLLDLWDVTDDLIKQGLITPTFQFRDRQEGLIGEFDFNLLKDDTNHPYRLQCEQFKFTGVLYHRLRDMANVRFLMSSEALGVAQTAENVTLTAATPDGEQSITGDFLIGCDGASSIIRKKAEIRFEGFTYPELFLVVSTPDNLREIIPDLGYVAYIADPHEWCTVIKVLDFWRILYPTIPGMAEEDILDDDHIQKMVQEFVPKSTPYDVVHKTLYRIHQRVAERYRNGRIFLAGDSAHINSPLGGMGMNGGLHDGISLAIKLIDVLKHGSNPELLDDYESERRPIAVEHVQKSTIHNKNVMEETDPEKRRATNDQMRETAADPVKSRAYMLETSMINMVRETRLLDAAKKSVGRTDN